MKKIVFTFAVLLAIFGKAYGQSTYVLFQRDVVNMGKSKYINRIIGLNKPRGYYESSFSYSGNAFSGVHPVSFYTIDKNVFTVIPIAQVSQDYPNALTHAWLVNYMKTTDIDVAAGYLDNLPNIYIIEMLPALGVAHIHRVKYITPHH